jgi:nanoRNase/pAp phosphatase (c-di-AMP/oligoRNAs hydrolase)
MSTESLTPSSNIVIKEVTSDQDDNSVFVESATNHDFSIDDEKLTQETTFSAETIPSLSSNNKDLKQIVSEELATNESKVSDTLGLLPPEDGESLPNQDQSFTDHEDLSVSRESSPPRVPSLGLDALGDSQSPQPVSLTPNPRQYVDQHGDDQEVEYIDDELNHSVTVLPLPPADLDLIAHSPPTSVKLPADSSLSAGILDPELGILEEEPTPTPRIIASLPHQRKLTEKNCRKLEAFVASLELARGSNVLIVIKGHPDPDCLGSASALQYCYREFEIQSSILYFDEISHPENRALVKVIEMEMTLYDKEFDFSGFDYLAFVDSQDATINGQDMNQLPPLLTFVDHHKETGKVQAEFIDIREDLGATSSIFSEYIEYLPELSLQKSLTTHAYIATALMHGIRTDTDDLMLASANDFYAAGYLRQFIDRDLLRMVSKQSVTARTMEIITKGLNNKIIKGTFLLAGVGFVREEDRDGIAQTADFLIRHEGVETAVVFGIVNEKHVDGSLRTSSATVDPDRWLKELFGNDESGRPFGGGRRNKGGFRIPLGLLGRSPNRKALWQLGEQTIHDIIFEKIGEKDMGDDSKGVTS